MAHQLQRQKSTTPNESEVPTSVIRVANTEKLFKDVDRSLNISEIDNKPPLTLLAVDSPSSASEIVDSSDDLTSADTTKMIESDSDCSRTILVDTKTLNRQKELDERYGG